MTGKQALNIVSSSFDCFLSEQNTHLHSDAVIPNLALMVRTPLNLALSDPEPDYSVVRSLGFDIHAPLIASTTHRKAGFGES